MANSKTVGLMRHQIYTLEGKTIEFSSNHDATNEASAALRECKPGSHHVSVDGPRVSILGWANGTAPSQRALITQAIASRTHPAFVRFPSTIVAVADDEPDAEDEEEREERDNEEFSADEFDGEEDEAEEPEAEEAPPKPTPPKRGLRPTAPVVESVKPAHRGRNALITVNGMSLPLAEWCSRLGKAKATIYSRAESVGSLENAVAYYLKRQALDTPMPTLPPVTPAQQPAPTPAPKAKPAQQPSKYALASAALVGDLHNLLLALDRHGSLDRLIARADALMEITAKAGAI